METREIEQAAAEARGHARRWTRNPVTLPAVLEIRLENGERFGGGTAIVRDIGFGGARLGKIVLEKQALPAESFRVMLTFCSEPYRGIGAVGRPVRFGRGDEFELAVEFEDIWASEEL
ncbi:MAG: hypothetical protein HYY16_00010 [Planctomycetes bacterium]|nr:hypothetical protein [Planctomycetota bacterium]